ncbi:MAG: protein translocase subunit SecF [Peptococcaceae bacterium]|nr:protein translocase subunit SecF [Peptococcaceae bacterium]
MASMPAVAEANYEQVKKEHRLYFNIVKRRYLWFAISLLVLIPGIISLIAQGLNLGIDFKGGSLYNIKFDQAVTQQNITEALESVGISGQVQLSDGNTYAIIRTAILSDTQRASMIEALQNKAGAFDLKNLLEDSVGPAIGEELRRGAIYSLSLAAVLILLYISIRFRFIYACSAVIALIHDVVIILGLFSLFQWQVDAPFIAAILTVFGYSINDTVVIYDRIRENERRMKKRDSFEDMVDKSVWQTMGRSIKTSVTVFIALLCIYILGGESTKVFALAMMIGVIAGTYSSIFVASQLIVEIKRWFSGDKRKKAVEA